MKIGILLGDDIGLEVVPEASRWRKPRPQKPGSKCTGRRCRSAEERARGARHHFPRDHRQKTLKDFDGWILGPSATTPTRATIRPGSCRRSARSTSCLPASRPSKSFPNIKSVHKNVDLRRSARDHAKACSTARPSIAGAGEFRPNDEMPSACASSRARAPTASRARRSSIARTRKRKLVTAAHKEPVYKQVCGMFAEECRKVAKEYPDIEYNEG